MARPTSSTAHVREMVLVDEALHLGLDFHPQLLGFALLGVLIAPPDRGGFRVRELVKLVQGIFPPYWVVGGVGEMPEDEGGRNRGHDGQVADVPEGYRARASKDVRWCLKESRKLTAPPGNGRASGGPGLGAVAAVQ